MTTRILLFVGVAWAACSAFAGNFTLKTAPTSLSDWQSPASYVENAAPGAGDTVILPQHTTVLVHDDEMDFLSGLRLLKLQAADDSFVHFDLAEDHTLLCAVTAAGYSVRKGGIIKSGAGRLTLNSGTTDVYAGTSKNNYYCSLDVRGGVLVVGSALVSSINFQHVTIAAGGTLLVP